MTLGERLRYLREKKDLTQIQLSKALKITNAQVSRYELDQREPDYDILRKFASFFNVTIDYLLTGKDESASIGALQKEEHIHFLDLEGLDKEDIEEIERQIDYLRWKANQRRKK